MITNDIIINLINGISLSFGYCLILYGIISSFITDKKYSFLKLFIPILIVGILIGSVYIFILAPCLLLCSFIVLNIFRFPKLRNICYCLCSIILVYIQMFIMNIFYYFIGLTSSQMVELRKLFSYNIFNSLMFCVLSTISFFIIKTYLHKKFRINLIYVNSIFNKSIMLFIINLVFLVTLVSFLDI